MKTIKIADGTRVIVDGETHDFLGLGFKEACDYIRIPNDEELRKNLFAKLFCYGQIDLSLAYNGHTVVMELIPPTEDKNEEESED